MIAIPALLLPAWFISIHLSAPATGAGFSSSDRTTIRNEAVQLHDAGAPAIVGISGPSLLDVGFPARNDGNVDPLLLFGQAGVDDLSILESGFRLYLPNSESLGSPLLLVSHGGLRITMPRREMPFPESLGLPASERFPARHLLATGAKEIAESHHWSNNSAAESRLFDNQMSGVRWQSFFAAADGGHGSSFPGSGGFGGSGGGSFGPPGNGGRNNLPRNKDGLSVDFLPLIILWDNSHGHKRQLLQSSVPEYVNGLWKQIANEGLILSATEMEQTLKPSHRLSAAGITSQERDAILQVVDWLKQFGFLILEKSDSLNDFKKSRSLGDFKGKLSQPLSLLETSVSISETIAQSLERFRGCLRTLLVSHGYSSEEDTHKIDFPYSHFSNAFRDGGNQEGPKGIAKIHVQIAGWLANYSKQVEKLTERVTAYKKKTGYQEAIDYATKQVLKQYNLDRELPADDEESHLARKIIEQYADLFSQTLKAASDPDDYWRLVMEPAAQFVAVFLESRSLEEQLHNLHDVTREYVEKLRRSSTQQKAKANLKIPAHSLFTGMTSPSQQQGGVHELFFDPTRFMHLGLYDKTKVHPSNALLVLGDKLNPWLESQKAALYQHREAHRKSDIFTWRRELVKTLAAERIAVYSRYRLQSDDPFTTLAWISYDVFSDMMIAKACVAMTPKYFEHMSEYWLDRVDEAASAGYNWPEEWIRLVTPIFIENYPLQLTLRIQ